MEKSRSPERIYWGWVVCLWFFLLNTVCVGVAHSFNELFVPISKETHQSFMMLGWAGALPFGLTMMLSPAATWLYGKFSARQLAVVGILITSTSLVCTSLVRDHVAEMILVHGVVSGIGLTCIVNPPYLLLAQYFPYAHKRHVLATSIIVCALPMATLVFNPVIYELLEAVGWRYTYCILAILLLSVGLPAAATFRPVSSDDLQQQQQQASIGCTGNMESHQQSVTPLELDGNVVSPHMGQQSSTESLPPVTQDSATAPSSGANTATLGSAEGYQMRAKIVISILWFVASTLKCFGFFTPFITLVEQMDVLGIPQWKASRAMVAVGFCELFSRTAMSFYGDRLKGFMLQIYVVCSLVLCLVNAVGSFAYTFEHLLAFAISLGIVGGPIIAAMYSSCSEVVAGENVAALFSLFRVGLGIGAVLGPTTAGAVYDATKSFRAMYSISAVTYGLTAVTYASIIILNRYRPSCLFRRPQATRRLPTAYGADETTDTLALYGSELSK